MKIQFEMTIDFPEELEQEIEQNKEEYMKEILESMQESCRSQDFPASVKIIDENANVVKALENVSKYATACGQDDYFHYDAFQTYIQHLIKEYGAKNGV